MKAFLKILEGAHPVKMHSLPGGEPTPAWIPAVIIFVGLAILVVVIVEALKED